MSVESPASVSRHSVAIEGSVRPGEALGSRVVTVATSNERLGTNYFARRLSAVLGSHLLATEQPLFDLLETIRTRSPAICHLEFEYRSFGGPLRTFLNFPRFAAGVARLCPLVITVHGLVPRNDSVGRWTRLNFFAYRALLRRAARSAAAVVVPSDRMRVELERSYRISNAVVIPLACDPPPPPGPTPEYPYLLFFGFVRPSKGVIELLEAFTLVGTEFPELRLVIAGTPAKHYETTYAERVAHAVARHPFRDRIIVYSHFIERTEKERLARGAAMIVLPYKDRFVEVSGVVHDFATSGAPIVCSDVPRFDELREGEEAVHVPPTAKEIARGVRQVWKDARLRARLEQGLTQLGIRESWEIVGRMHLELYSRTLSGTAGGLH